MSITLSPSKNDIAKSVGKRVEKVIKNTLYANDITLTIRIQVGKPPLIHYSVDEIVRVDEEAMK